MSYQDFIKEVKALNTLSCISGLLQWDQQTQMPKKCLEQRAQQSELLSGLVHQRFTSPKLGEMLAALTEAKNWGALSEVEQVNVREVKRAYDRAVKLPTRLVQEISRVCSLGNEAWAEARQKNQYELFASWLEQQIKLQREAAQCYGFANAYDGLMDEYEPGSSAAEVEKLFARLKKDLIPLAGWAQEQCQQAKQSPVVGKFPRAVQEKVSKILLGKMGFDLESGRLDTAVHPFCIGLAGDVRLTTRYDEEDFRPAFYGTIHEGGHGLYEQGFLPEHRNTPMGQATSLGIHESQSRFWENVIGRSHPFCKHMLPVLKQSFPQEFASVTEEQLFWWVNQVRPSLIRVEADEVTYHLHILLRFELEQAMIDGSVSVKELPHLWNEKMKQYLGLNPPTETLGILQDVHWSIGSIGYFSTYTLGSLYAAQWMRRMKQEMPNCESRIANGELLPIRDWLREKIHHRGQYFRATELCKDVTGEPLNPQYFVDYIREKFSG